MNCLIVKDVCKSYYDACLPVGHPVPRSVDKVTLSLTTFPLDVLCDVVPFCEHVNELKCEDLKDPKQVCIYSTILVWSP